MSGMTQSRQGADAAALPDPAGVMAGQVPISPNDPPPPVPPSPPAPPGPDEPDAPIEDPPGPGAPSPDEPDAPPVGDPPSAPPVRMAPREIGGPAGPEPTRYGDWERKGRVSDF